MSNPHLIFMLLCLAQIFLSHFFVHSIRPLNSINIHKNIENDDRNDMIYNATFNNFNNNINNEFNVNDSALFENNNNQKNNLDKNDYEFSVEHLTFCNQLHMAHMNGDSFDQTFSFDKIIFDKIKLRKKYMNVYITKCPLDDYIGVVTRNETIYHQNLDKIYKFSNYRLYFHQYTPKTKEHPTVPYEFMFSLVISTTNSWLSPKGKSYSESYNANDIQKFSHCFYDVENMPEKTQGDKAKILLNDCTSPGNFEAYFLGSLVEHTYYIEPDISTYNNKTNNIENIANYFMIPHKLWLYSARIDENNPEFQNQLPKNCSYIDSITPILLNKNASNTRKRPKRELILPEYQGHSPLVIELYIVNDNSQYKKWGKDKNKVILRTLQISHILNAIFKQLNILVALVGLEVWTERDKVTLSQDGDLTLKSFNKYRQSSILPRISHDNAQLLTAHHFNGGVIGKAIKRQICAYSDSTGVAMDHNDLVGPVASTMAHELGHSLGMDHDTEICDCPDRVCVMTPASGSYLATKWSACSLQYLSYSIARGMDACLMNKPDRVYDTPMCGNGFLEPGEECDCGLPEFCQNKCCNAKTCKLAINATCATGSCCNFYTCQIRPAASLCRPSQGICDLPEYCDGRTENCPLDTFVADGHPCLTRYQYQRVNAPHLDSETLEFKVPKPDVLSNAARHKYEKTHSTTNNKDNVGNVNVGNGLTQSMHDRNVGIGINNVFSFNRNAGKNQLDAWDEHEIMSSTDLSDSLTNTEMDQYAYKKPPELTFSRSGTGKRVLGAIDENYELYKDVYARGHCWSGQCNSFARQCKLLWGPSGKMAVPMCFKQNAFADKTVRQRAKRQSNKEAENPKNNFYNNTSLLAQTANYSNRYRQRTQIKSAINNDNKFLLKSNSTFFASKITEKRNVKTAPGRPTQHSNGDCGYNIIRDEYTSCPKDEYMCGRLHCVNDADRLAYGETSGKKEWHSFIRYSSALLNAKGQLSDPTLRYWSCHSTFIDLGPQVLDAGMVPNGASCAKDSICVNQTCTPKNALKLPKCPKDCNGKGICNNKGHCHCFQGFGGSACERRGPGGSPDSGPATFVKKIKPFVKAMLIIFLCLLPALILCSVCVYKCVHRNQSPSAAYYNSTYYNRNKKKAYSTHGDRFNFGPGPFIKTNTTNKNKENFTNNEGTRLVGNSFAFFHKFIRNFGSMLSFMDTTPSSTNSSINANLTSAQPNENANKNMGSFPLNPKLNTAKNSNFTGKPPFIQHVLFYPENKGTTNASSNFMNNILQNTDQFKQIKPDLSAWPLSDRNSGDLRPTIIHPNSAETIVKQEIPVNTENLLSSGLFQPIRPAPPPPPSTQQNNANNQKKKRKNKKIINGNNDKNDRNALLLISENEKTQQNLEHFFERQKVANNTLEVKNNNGQNLSSLNRNNSNVSRINNGARPVGGPPPIPENSKMLLNKNTHIPLPSNTINTLNNSNNSHLYQNVIPTSNLNNNINNFTISDTEKSSPPLIMPRKNMMDTQPLTPNSGGVTRTNPQTKNSNAKVQRNESTVSRMARMFEAGNGK